MSENVQTSFIQRINLIDPLRQQYTIPTYRLEIDSDAAFKENDSESGSREDPKAKRNLYTIGKPKTSSNNPIIGTAWAFSLDGKDLLGPCDMVQECDVIFEIDARKWGVLVQPIEDMTVSVWI
jgi:hypothetical protein